jgi:outer membrane protein
MIRRSLKLHLICAGLALASAVTNAQAAVLRVGIVTDGRNDREILSPAGIEQQIDPVSGKDPQIVLPADKRFAGDWSVAGADAALNRALADKDVDVVVTLGVLSSQQAAHREKLTKPVIAALVIDPQLQRYPLAGGVSGRGNFTYIADFQGLRANVEAFHHAVNFKHLAALVDESLLRSIPEIAAKADALAASLSVRISLVAVGSSPQAALQAIPADADAVYVTGLMHFNWEAIQTLAQGLANRHLPSFSLIGRSEVESGLLMTTGGAQRDTQRLARRVVLMIERIAAGENPADFEVAFPTEQRLAINMTTAREIGYSPAWQVLADAEQLAVPAAASQGSLTMLEAMKAALAQNPSLAATRARLQSSADDVSIARSGLLPSVSASAARVEIDGDRASSFGQPQRTSSAEIAAQQVVYSESVWANYSISRALLEASRQGERQAALDTLTSAASAYLSLLRAKAIESVRLRNVENTRKNLEIARVRENVGLGGRSDRLRWVSQLARDKQDLLSAESTRRQAETELTRVIHWPSGRSLATSEADLDGPLALVSSPRMRALLGTPATWSVFSDYAVYTALEQAPEIAQTDAAITARERAVTAARRAYFLPDLAIVSKGSKNFQKSGIGSDRVPGAPNDDSWSISLQASLPIFTGGLRHAQLSQARHELSASQADRTNAKDAVEARTRAALHRTASSYPSIALSAESAGAAAENLAMVSDAYARGAVPITDLIDAQDTSLGADLAAADAKYVFLNDFVNVLRATSEFDILLEPSARAAWLSRVETWFASHSMNTTSPRP